MIQIVTDTTSGLPLELVRELGIPMLPQMIIFGEETYRDDTELDTENFLNKLRASTVLPHTSAPAPTLYTPIFEQLLRDGCETIICLHPSAELSGTVSFAQVAAQEFPNADIRVIDTRTIAAPLATIVLLADQWAKAGVDADTIVTRVQGLMERQRIFFVVDTLEYLHRGGRIGGAKALLGGLLQIKPILQLVNGRIEPFEQQRTSRRALGRLRELVLESCPHSPDAHLAMMHADAEDEARAIAEELEPVLGLSEIPIYQVPPAIVVHAGPGLLGAGFFVGE